MQTVPIPHPVSTDSSAPENSPEKTTPRAFPLGSLEAAREARKLKESQWSTLSLRQTFADESVMRDHIKAAGLRSPSHLEPATVSRLRTLLNRAKVQGPEISASVGTTLRGFLLLNPSLPLWAALAMVLEATGRFTVNARQLG